MQQNKKYLVVVVVVVWEQQQLTVLSVIQCRTQSSQRCEVGHGLFRTFAHPDFLFLFKLVVLQPVKTKSRDISGGKTGLLPSGTLWTQPRHQEHNISPAKLPWLTHSSILYLLYFMKTFRQKYIYIFGQHFVNVKWAGATEGNPPPSPWWWCQQTYSKWSSNSVCSCSENSLSGIHSFTPVFKWYWFCILKGYQPFSVVHLYYFWPQQQVSTSVGL